MHFFTTVKAIQVTLGKVRNKQLPVRFSVTLAAELQFDDILGASGPWSKSPIHVSHTVLGDSHFYSLYQHETLLCTEPVQACVQKNFKAEVNEDSHGALWQEASNPETSSPTFLCWVTLKMSLQDKPELRIQNGEDNEICCFSLLKEDRSLTWYPSTSVISFQKGCKGSCL